MNGRFRITKPIKNVKSNGINFSRTLISENRRERTAGFLFIFPHNMMIKKYTLAWFGMMLLAILNGTLRDFGYKPFTGALAAHQISTLTLILLLFAYIYILEKKMPIATAKQAWIIGILWLLMTEVFEFGLGLRRGASWHELLHAYNICAGQVWIFVPLFILTAPALCRKILLKK